MYISEKTRKVNDVIKVRQDVKTILVGIKLAQIVSQ